MLSSTAESARILLADEDPVLAGTVAWFLGEHGYAVSRAAGEEVLERLRVTGPDLLMIDVGMRAVDVYDLLARIRSDGRWRDMPVLATAAAGAPDTMSRLLSLGATDYLPKPFHVAELLARVQVQLRLRHELVDARTQLQSAEVELKQARAEAESRRKLADILHEVAGDFSTEEMYHILVRRVALALGISRCSLVLARAGGETGVVAASYESPVLRNLEIQLERYPEITAALERGEPVLVEDVPSSDLYAKVREEWASSRRSVRIQSVIVLPFALDYRTGGVFFLRTVHGEEPLTHADVDFANAVVRTAVTAIRRARAVETTLADKARLELLALTDPLTQTLNRRALVERLTAELERARRYSLMLSILVVDLDHFKAVNDTYGHLIGDEVLRAVARTLQREARAVDIVARYGGEEFVVVLPETGEEGAVAVAERIRQKVAEYPAQIGEQRDRLKVTVSIGVATATATSTRVNAPDDLIAGADEALYRAKAQGRNRVCV